MKIFLSVCMVLSSLFATAQAVETMTFEAYIDAVQTGHPMMAQVGLQADIADNTVRMARGGFDPKLEGDWQKKAFDDKNYYSVGGAAVKLPTWYGVELKAAYDRSSGIFLDNSDALPTRGLLSAGVSVGLGRGLVIDNRRAELQKAKIFQESTAEIQRLMANDLIFEATQAYLNWQIATANLTIAEEGLILAQTRLDGVISSFVNGDKPAIDTLETYIAWQNRSIEYEKLIQESTNAIIDVNNYLWVDREVPVELEDGTVPDPLDVFVAADLVDSLTVSQSEWLDQHPELRIYDFKLEELDVDVKLAKEDLKPDVRIDYNPLIAVGENQIFDQFSPSNYKIGATVSYPLMQRKQRGKLQINRIKVESTAYDQAIKRQSLDTKLDQYLNNISRLSTQYNLVTETAENYRLMLVGENRKLEVGESSVFLVNTRESKYLDSRYKSIEAAGKVVKNRLTYLYLAAWLDRL